MTQLLCVCVGSALGGGARYLLIQAALAWLGMGFPYGTLAVNTLGSFLLGALAEGGARGVPLAPGLRLFLGAGVLGGFTTYSSFNQETLQLAAQSGPLALLNTALTVLGCLLAGALGVGMVRALLSVPATG